MSCDECRGAAVLTPATPDASTECTWCNDEQPMLTVINRDTGTTDHLGIVCMYQWLASVVLAMFGVTLELPDGDKPAAAAAESPQDGSAAAKVPAARKRAGKRTTGADPVDSGPPLVAPVAPAPDGATITVLHATPEPESE